VGALWRRVLGLVAAYGLLTLIALPILLSMVVPRIWPGIFADKYYDYPRVIVEARVHPDGSMTVVERRTFDFQKGSFSFAYADIDHRLPGDIVGVGVTEGRKVYKQWQPTGPLGPLDPGTLSIEDSFSRMHVEWRFAAEDEERTFTLRYRALCAVNAYSDGAHLYWQFVPDEIDKPTDYTRITIHLPPHFEPTSRPPGACGIGAVPARRLVAAAPLEPRETRAWGHGPLEGNVTIPSPQTVVLKVRDLAPFTFVEGSVVFPLDAVPLEPLTSAGVGPDPDDPTVTSAAEVLHQEDELAADANSRRRRAHLVHWLWRALAIAFPVLLIGIVIASRMRDRVPGVPRLLQEPPEEIHPVDLALLWGSFTSSTLGVQNAYRAQLLSLAEQGVIRIDADGLVSKPKDLRVTLVDKPEAGLDSDFTEFLFADKGVGPVKLSELKAQGKRGKELRDWSKVVTSHMKAQLKERRGRWEAVAVFWLAVVLGVWSYIAAGIVSGGLERWGIAEAILGWIVARPFIRPWFVKSDRHERIARWAAFRRFLRKFSSLPDAPALAVIIWERYLVEAAALGVADEVARQVRTIVPESELPAPWHGAPAGTRGFFVGRSVAARAPVTSSVAATASGHSSGGSFSSSGGGGGGFSGGGGGGGGGGGRGAG
jgi:uncharacterized membrane protein YgcG